MTTRVVVGTGPGHTGRPVGTFRSAQDASLSCWSSVSKAVKRFASRDDNTAPEPAREVRKRGLQDRREQSGQVWKRLRPRPLLSRVWYCPRPETRSRGSADGSADRNGARAAPPSERRLPRPAHANHSACRTTNRPLLGKREFRILLTGGHLPGRAFPASRNGTEAAENVRGRQALRGRGRYRESGLRAARRRDPVRGSR